MTFWHYSPHSRKMPVTPSYTRDLNMWIKELASALTCDLDTFGKALFAESKVQALCPNVE